MSVEIVWVKTTNIGIIIIVNFFHHSESTMMKKNKHYNLEQIFGPKERSETVALFYISVVDYISFIMIYTCL